MRGRFGCRRGIGLNREDFLSALNTIIYRLLRMMEIEGLVESTWEIVESGPGRNVRR